MVKQHRQVHPDDTVGNLRPLVLAAARPGSTVSRLSITYFSGW